MLEQNPLLDLFISSREKLAIYLASGKILEGTVKVYDERNLILFTDLGTSFEVSIIPRKKIEFIKNSISSEDSRFINKVYDVLKEYKQ